ncbi:MAG: YibE/F family protein [Acutalibacteraceae bacterium]
MKLSLKTFITYFILFAFCIVFLFFGYRICKSESNEEKYEKYATARITEIVSVEAVDSVLSGEGESGTQVVFNARLTSGDNRGKTVQVIQYIDSVYSYREKQVEQGDRVILVSYASKGTADSWQFAEYNRLPWLAELLALFFLLILIIGKIKGVGTILSLCITAAAILLVYIPGITKGYNVYALTVIVSSFVIVSSLVMLNGISKKTLCASVGNICGVLAAAGLAFIFNHFMYITGIVDENYIYLTYMEIPINLKAVVWGGTVIGAVGAVMDVSIEIASSMHELALHMREKNFKNMVKSGMNIGKDAIGTMTNTLILAYVGCALASLLLMTTYSKSLLYLINTEMIIVELMQAIIGSMGILFAVPLTAFFSAWVYNFGKQKPEKKTRRRHYAGKKSADDDKPLTDEEFWGTRF